MKIIQLISALDHRGGGELLFSNLCLELVKRKDVELRVIILYDNIDGSILKDFIENGVQFFTCGKKSKFDIKCSKRMKSFIKDFSPDIINIHLSCWINYFIAFKFKKRRWKLVKTFHSIPGFDLNRISLSIEKKYVRKKLVAFIGISETITKKAAMLYSQCQIATIENGIKIVNENDNITLLKLQKTYDFIIVAALEPVKNHFLLFDSILSLRSQYPTISLCVVGEGSLFGTFQEYINNRGASKNIDLVGFQPNVFNYLYKSKCFVLSSNREGNPLSILEAMSARLPIIAPRIGGIPDIVKNNINGLLFEPGNKGQLIDCLKEFLNNENKYFQIGVNNREYVKSYSIESTANRYFDFYKELILLKGDQNE